MNISKFINKLKIRLNEYKERNQFVYFKEYDVIATEGKKYFKVYRQEIFNDDKKNTPAIVAFVDKTTGDIFKPATFAAPAKGVRGNVLSVEDGMEAIDESGFVHYQK